MLVTVLRTWETEMDVMWTPSLGLLYWKERIYMVMSAL